MPTAYPAALIYLVDVYQAADSPYCVKYGALLGIERHIICGIAPAQHEKIIDLLLETIAIDLPARGIPLKTGPAEQLEPAVWDCFRQKALDGIATLKTVGTDGKVVATLLTVIDAKSQELEVFSRVQDILTRENLEQTRRAIELASKAAKTLGDLDYKSVKDIDTKKLSDTLIVLTKNVCNVGEKMAADSIKRGGTSPEPAKLLEQIVVDTKVCIQSIAWGIPGGILTSRPGENSFYAVLPNDEPTKKNLELLREEIIKLTTFFDEGDKTRPSTSPASDSKAFKFDLPVLRDALAKTSETIAKIE
jgi:hypothetical protein